MSEYEIRNRMINKVAHKFGLESGTTIAFAILCDSEVVKQDWIVDTYKNLIK